jgi:hypothetical protein
MSVSAIHDIVMGLNAPPGLIHPIFKENYAWVDERLRSIQYSYQYDYDDCENSIMLRPCPISWVDYRYNHIAKGIEEFEEPIVIDYKRKRAESDISDHENDIENAFKKLRTNDVNVEHSTKNKKVFTPLSNPFCNLDCEEYNYKCSLIDQEDDEAELIEEVNNIFTNWDSIVKAEEVEEETQILDNVSVQASYFDSDIDDDFDNMSEISYCKEDEEERRAFEEMMDGYDSDEWYINLAYYR